MAGHLMEYVEICVCVCVSGHVCWVCVCVECMTLVLCGVCVCVCVCVECVLLSRGRYVLSTWIIGLKSPEAFSFPLSSSLKHNLLEDAGSSQPLFSQASNWGWGR